VSASSCSCRRVAVAWKSSCCLVTVASNSWTFWCCYADADGKLGTNAVDAAGNKVPLASLLGGQRQAILNDKVETLQATVAQQQKQIETLIVQLKEQADTFTAQLKEQAAQIQKVSAQLELNKPAPQTVKNDD
jgi:gas vesicle protein